MHFKQNIWYFYCMAYVDYHTPFMSSKEEARVLAHMAHMNALD